MKRFWQMILRLFGFRNDKRDHRVRPVDPEYPRDIPTEQKDEPYRNEEDER